MFKYLKDDQFNPVEELPRALVGSSIVDPVRSDVVNYG